MNVLSMLSQSLALRVRKAKLLPGQARSLLAVLLIFALPACGGGETPGTGEGEGEAEAEGEGEAEAEAEEMCDFKGVDNTYATLTGTATFSIGPNNYSCGWDGGEDLSLNFNFSNDPEVCPSCRNEFGCIPCVQLFHSGAGMAYISINARGQTPDCRRGLQYESVVVDANPDGSVRLLGLESECHSLHFGVGSRGNQYGGTLILEESPGVTSGTYRVEVPPETNCCADTLCFLHQNRQNGRGNAIQGCTLDSARSATGTIEISFRIPNND